MTDSHKHLVLPVIPAEAPACLRIQAGSGEPESIVISNIIFIHKNLLLKQPPLSYPKIYF